VAALGKGLIMETCIALFRGINIGGKNLLPMKEVVAILETIGRRLGVRSCFLIF
jgi:uncharacterized protein (DUF1697 family)